MIIRKLLGFAASSSAHAEDAITELLAFVVREDRAKERILVTCLDEILGARGRPQLPTTRPRVSTQVVVGGAGPDAGRCDLVLDWAAERVRVVLEVKITAPLTWTSSGGRAQHQVDRYLSVVSDDSFARGLVFVLSPDRIDIGDAVGHTSFGGHVPAQRLHDLLRRSVRGRDAASATDWAARELYLAMEDLRMATPTMTLDGLTSVYRFVRFRDALHTALSRARDELLQGGPLAKFAGPKRNELQNAFERMGLKVWARDDHSGAFAFIGIALDDASVHEEVPDLYFFLELPPKDTAHTRVRTWIEEHPAEMERLRTTAPTLRWNVGGADSYQLIEARATLLDAVAAPDPAARIAQFFRQCAVELDEVGLLGEYLAAVDEAASARARTR